MPSGWIPLWILDHLILYETPKRGMGQTHKFNDRIPGLVLANTT